MSVLLVACNNVNAQTLESITRYRKYLGEVPQIIVDNRPTDIQINQYPLSPHNTYVANKGSDTVSVIDGYSGNPKSIRLGLENQKVHMALDHGVSDD